MKIRDMRPDDLAAVIKLMKEFAAFERLSKYCTATKRRLFNVMFGKSAFVNGLVAEDNGKIIAYSLFYPNYATFRGQRGTYLEDIYISPTHQGKGVGEAMLRKIAKASKRQGCERIDFQVLDWNTAAIGFYERLGAVPDDTERHFKFIDKAFDRLAR